MGSFTFDLNTKLSAGQRLDKCVSELIAHERYRIMCGVFMIGDRTVGDVPTACTNGRDEIYGKKFIEEVLIDDPSLRFVVLHENYHKLRRHLHVFKKLADIDRSIANQAFDHVINLEIIAENPDGWIRMPVDAQGNPIGLADRRFIGMDETQVFNILMDEKKSQQQPNGAGGQPQPSGDSGDSGDSGGSGDNGTGIDDHDWDGAASLSQVEEDQLARDVMQAVQQGARLAGKTGGGSSRFVNELLKPEVDWKAVLQEFAIDTCSGTDDATWRKPHPRHLARGVLRQSHYSERAEELVLAIDTSGSIGQCELTKFLSEVQSILDIVSPKLVRLVYWDTKVRSEEQYGEYALPLDQLSQSTKPLGGGGTDVACVSNYLAENHIKPEAIIIFTDGYLGGDWGTWDEPVLWCVLNNKRATPDCGRTLHINL